MAVPQNATITSRLGEQAGRADWESRLGEQAGRAGSGDWKENFVWSPVLSGLVVMSRDCQLGNQGSSPSQADDMFLCPKFDCFSLATLSLAKIWLKSESQLGINLIK